MKKTRFSEEQMVKILREVAINVYREALPEIAAKAIGDAFSLSCRLPGCADLSIEDASPMFVSAFRQELDKPAL